MKNALLLSLLLVICAGGCVADAQNRTANIPDELVGEWHNGSVGTIQYENRVTGATTPGRGSTFTYRFYADGRFEFIGMMQSTMYNCTTTLFNDKRGHVEVGGSSITFTPTKNYWKNTNSCAPSSNKEKNHVLNSETQELVFKKDEYGRSLFCLVGENGESCFRKKETNE